MARRIIVAKPSFENVQQIQSTLHRVGTKFEAKNDPQKSLADEIEACRKLIWQCVGGKEAKQDQGQEETRGEAETSQPSMANELSTSAQLCQKQSHPSRVNIEFRVNAMKVVELRKELRDRDLDTDGLKKQLQARLREAMFDEMEPRINDPTVQQKDESVKEATVETLVEAKRTEAPIESNDDPKDGEEDTKMDDVSEVKVVAKASAVSHQVKAIEVPKLVEDSPAEESKPRAIKLTVKPESLSPLEKLSAAVVSPKKQQMDQGSSNIKQYWKKFSKPVQATISSPFKASASKNTAAKEKKSPIRMVVKKAQNTQNAPSEIDLSSQDLMITHSKSDLSEDDFERPVSDFSAASGSGSMSKTACVKDLVSKIQNCNAFTSATTATSVGSTSALSKNLQAKKEARLARMAEIRGKSKPVVTSKLVLAPKEYSATLSSLNAVSAPGKKNNLAAQMREKAAAAAMRKENVSSNSNQMQTSMGSGGTGKRTLPSSQSNTSSSNDTLGSTVKQGFSKKPKVASPMDTYEISDREESDCDSSDSDSESEKQKKKIPVWALKANLLPVLEQQYNGCVDGKRVDPDSIFPEVQTCDLEAIFGGKKSRYTRRTSSGNWTQDKVTAAEKLVYKRTMGFVSKS